MKTDALFFIGIIVFFFILWYATGGPNKPISFAGPYITPITDVDTVQEGYGSTGSSDFSGGSSNTGSGNVWLDIMNIQDSVASLQRKSSEIQAFGVPSPYKGQVTVTGTGNVWSNDPDQEYVTIRASGDTPVDITGWRIVSGATGNVARIPTGAIIPKGGDLSEVSDIVLQPGDQAIIVTGESPIGVSFRENMCTGYLAHSQDFYPSLQNSCPAARDEFDRFYTGNKLNDDACYTLMNNASSCTTPSDNKHLSNACISLIDEHLTYNGCVKTHRYDARFSSNTWHIYLNYENRKGDEDEFWKSSRDAIKLIDENGKTVDLYTY